MSRSIDMSKPLSKKDVEYLGSRYSRSYVDRMVELSGSKKSESSPETVEVKTGAESGPEGDEGSENSAEDLIGEPEGEFDPGEHTADQVLVHLRAASVEEKLRVRDLETDGKHRRTVLDYQY